MRRLSITVFLAVLGSLIVFAIAVAGAWRLGIESRTVEFERQLSSDLADGAVPAAGRSRAELMRALERWHDRAKVDLALYDADGRLLARAGRAILPGGARNAAPATGMHPGAGPHGMAGARDGVDASPRRRWVATVELADGRTLYVRPSLDRQPRTPIGLAGGLVLLLLAVALVAWPVSRRITRRLERLQQGVDKLGSGDLAARVAVEGKDEVAALARSFNASAGRVEELVNAKSRLLETQRRLLANASHELRSPLARMRMGFELLRGEEADERAKESLRAEIERNIGELDQLVDEILTASRLDNADHALEFAPDPVDLAGIAAEEAARVGAEVEVAERVGGPDPADAFALRGDPRLLRRLVRNLLENALRHHPAPSGASDPAAAPEPVRVVLARDDDAIRLEVLDRGPGVPAAERERIFEAFYRPGGHPESAGGVGLGLALARQIARAHDGTVACEARAGGGARFVVRLPAA
ncbi:MAG: ATP-binding protein [Lautropia sp.]